MESQIMHVLRFIALITVYTIMRLQNISFMDVFYFVIPIFMILWPITNVALRKEYFSKSLFCYIVNLASPILVLIGYVFYIIYLIFNKSFHLIPISLLIIHTWFRFASHSLKRFKEFMSKRKNSIDAKASHWYWLAFYYFIFQKLALKLILMFPMYILLKIALVLVKFFLFLYKHLQILLLIQLIQVNFFLIFQL